MEQCPKCGHWTMHYVSVDQEWRCWCQYYINPKCPCKHTIPESRESYYARLLENNKRGKHSIEPPVR